MNGWETDAAGRVIGSVGRFGTGYHAGDHPAMSGRIRPGDSTAVCLESRNHVVGGVGHGIVDRSVDSSGLQTRRYARYQERAPSRSALCQGRQRLGIGPVRRVFEHVVGPLGQGSTRGVFYRGLRLMGLDSTVYDERDTEANEAAFGRPSGGDRGPGAFPQVRKISLVELGTHAEIALVRMRREHARKFRGLVRDVTLGTLSRTNRAASQPRQPPRDQTENVQVEKETPKTPPTASTNQNLCRGRRYALLNGIAPNTDYSHVVLKSMSLVNPRSLVERCQKRVFLCL